MSTPTKTVPMVRLEDYLRLAELGRTMRAAQKAYFKLRREKPHVPADAEWRAARDAEKRFDSAVDDALARQRVKLPGFDDVGE